MLATSSMMALGQPMPAMHMLPGDPVYVRPNTPGLARNTVYSASGVTLRSWLDANSCCEGQLSSDIWGYTDSSTGREYALIVYHTGLAVVDVTSSSPTVVGRVASPSSFWKDVKTYGQYAYLVTEADSAPDIVVVDLSRVSSGVVSVANTIRLTAGTASTHNVAIDVGSGYLYRLGGGTNPMRVYSLAQPTSPVYVASIGDGYVHDAEIITFSSGPYAGRQIAFACKAEGAHGLQIWDVTVKSSPSLLSFVTWPQPVYSHNVWVDAPSMTAYTSDELGDRQGRGVSVHWGTLDDH